jgi:hypothetical protein
MPLFATEMLCTTPRSQYSRSRHLPLAAHSPGAVCNSSTFSETTHWSRIHVFVITLSRNIITPRVLIRSLYLRRTKQTSTPQDRQFPRKHSIPYLLAPGTRNTHSTESAFCNSLKKRPLVTKYAMRDPAAWLCRLSALAGLASFFVCPRG